MFKSPLPSRSRHSLSVLALCLAAGLTFTFAPTSASAQSKKAAAGKKEAKAEEKEESAPVTPREPDAALKEFKADMATLKKWSNAQEAKAKDNPLNGLRMLKEMSNRLNKVRTDGLPEDLESEYKVMTGVITKMAAMFEGMPEDDAEFQTWAQAKFTDADFGAKMEKLGAAAKTSGEKLKEIAKEHGIEDLDFDSKDEEEEAAEDDDEKKPAKKGKAADDDDAEEKEEK